MPLRYNPQFTYSQNTIQNKEVKIMPTGGGSYDPTGNPGVPDGGKCPTILRDVNLISPDDSVLSKLTVNSQLNLEVIEISGKSSLRAFFNGKDAGGIVSTQAGQLIKCILDGHRYIAIVTSLDGGSCILEVRMAEDSAQ